MKALEDWYEIEDERPRSHGGNWHILATFIAQFEGDVVVDCDGGKLAVCHRSKTGRFYDAPHAYPYGVSRVYCAYCAHVGRAASQDGESFCVHKAALEETLHADEDQAALDYAETMADLQSVGYPA